MTLTAHSAFPHFLTEVGLGVENTGQSLVATPHRQHHFVAALPVENSHRQFGLGAAEAAKNGD
jgi:hypothetical protein